MKIKINSTSQSYRDHAVKIYVSLVTDDNRFIELDHPVIVKTAWFNRARELITGNLYGSLDNRKAWLQYTSDKYGIAIPEGDKIIAIWNIDRSKSLSFNTDTIFTPSQIQSAVSHINHRRNRIQAPLKKLDHGGWSTRTNPGEIWSDKDVVDEAERLEWSVWNGKTTLLQRA